jgi:sugar phosphate isomerase/epimerase
MTAEQAGFRHPLVATAEAFDHIERLGLNGNAGTTLTNEVEAMNAFSEVLVTGHAPSSLQVGSKIRGNIASTDDEFRDMSIRTILDYVDVAQRYPHLKLVNMHFAPKRWVDETQNQYQTGTYDRLIDGIRQIAAFAERRGIQIVLENNCAYFELNGIADDVPAEKMDWADKNEYFGVSPEEWTQICEDVDRPNVGLCLDTSHACTYAHTFPEDRRRERMLAFLAKPHLIRHVHWSDNYLYDTRGRNDSHVSVGKGSLPTELHRGIKRLDAVILLEHFYTIDELEQELEYVTAL